MSKVQVSWGISYNKVYAQTIIQLQTKGIRKSIWLVSGKEGEKVTNCQKGQSCEPKTKETESWRDERKVRRKLERQMGDNPAEGHSSAQGLHILLLFPIKLLHLCASWFNIWELVLCSIWCFAHTALTYLFFFLSVLQINLRLILVSGKTKEFLFSPNDSAADIAKHVYDNWPMGE